MNPIPFAEQTNVLGAPANWDPARDGACVELPVKFDPAGPTFTSIWAPTPEERETLAAGGAVRLTLYGNAHTPVWIDAVSLEGVPQGGAIATMTGAQWAEAHRLLRYMGGLPVHEDPIVAPMRERAAALLGAVYAAQPGRIRSAGHG